MRVCDIERGQASTLEIKSTEGGGFGNHILAMSEAGLFSSELNDEILLRIGDEAWEVRGVDDHHQDLLEKLTARNLPRVVWIATAIPPGSKKPKSLVLEVHEFPSEHIWPDLVDVGVDEKILDAIRQKRKRLVSINDVAAWLSECLLLPDSSGSNRVLISGSPNPQGQHLGGFRLYGKGVAVDIAKVQDDRLMVTRVVEARRPSSNDERRPVMLVRGHFRFVDFTVAGRFRGDARSQLDQIVEEADSYLSLWRDYNEIERESVLRRAREFGWLRYDACRPLSEGRWRFTLSDDTKTEGNILLREDTETVELEAADQPPAELTKGYSSTYDRSAMMNKRRVFYGECVSLDRHRHSLDLILPPGRDEEEVPPPEKGFLFISLTGDRKRIERRENAQARIASAECPMPQLGLLIEGKAVPERRRKNEKPLSTAAREAFGGEPTGRQIEALKVALNTPDIALI